VGDVHADTIVVMESAIDALSVYQLTENAALSLGGTSPLALEFALAHSPQISRVLLALDNDEAGRISCERIEQLLRDRFSGVSIERLLPPNGCKDWNEILQ
jgi:DNA primase